MSVLTVASSFAKGHLEPLLCLHQALRKTNPKSLDGSRLGFYHQLVGVPTDILGDSSVGPNLSTLTDILDSVHKDTMSDLIDSATSCAFGPVSGLSR